MARRQIVRWAMVICTLFLVLIWGMLLGGSKAQTQICTTFTLISCKHNVAGTNGSPCVCTAAQGTELGSDVQVGPLAGSYDEDTWHMSLCGN